MELEPVAGEIYRLIVPASGKAQAFRLHVNKFPEQTREKTAAMSEAPIVEVIHLENS